jgi:tRNA (guanine-N7-)-methyltransferase
LARVRVRQHVNPLCSKFQNTISAPNWREIYPNLTNPIHLDIGCARGRFLLEMAPLQPDFNFLGTEIREPLVTEANSIKNDLNLTNLHYVFCNINNSLEVILNSLPAGIVQYVTIQFPDPWFKQRHGKRRVVQPSLVETLAKYLPTNAEIFLQSDVKLVAEEMVARFSENPNFKPKNELIWLQENPLPIATEREKATLNKNMPVYRALFVKI